MRPRKPRLSRYGQGGLRFNPKAKLDPSQVQDLRWLGNINRAINLMEGKRQRALKPPKGLENFPFLTMQQRMKILQDYSRNMPGVPRPPLLAGSFNTWLAQMLDERRQSRPRSVS